MKLPTLGRKGEMANFAISGILALIIVAVLLYIMFPIFGGIQSATDPSGGNATRLGEIWGTGMAGAYGNSTNAIASGATLVGIVEIVIAAVVILGVLMIGLVSRK